MRWASTHFDPDQFREPEQFDPLPFVDFAPPDPFVCIPFGRGSHMCLGMLDRAQGAPGRDKPILYAPCSLYVGARPRRGNSHRIAGS